MKEKEGQGMKDATVTRERLFAHAREEYGVEPEFLWVSTPNCAVLRHQGNRKWFAAVLDVPKSRLGLIGEEPVDILDLKLGPVMVGSLLGRQGFLPAYHMNKTHWITVLLDGSVPWEEIEQLLFLSYRATQSRKKG